MSVERFVTRAGLGACLQCGQHFKVAAHDECPHCGAPSHVTTGRIVDGAGVRGGILAASLLGLSISAMACGSEDRDEPDAGAMEDGISVDDTETEDVQVQVDVYGAPGDIVEDIGAEDDAPVQDLYGGVPDVEEFDTIEDVPTEADVPDQDLYGAPPDVG